MIQKLNDRRRSGALALHKENISLDVDGPESWGSWYNRRFAPSNRHFIISYYQFPFSRFYSLVVVQQPIRARMCGFGDKVCQPIALTSTLPHL